MNNVSIGYYVQFFIKKLKDLFKLMSKFFLADSVRDEVNKQLNLEIISAGVGDKVDNI